ncbi:MAG: hypothetical protein PHF67_04730 [Candidatus Nanoarchaeia archaeon]|nr:hypothetical protein [Candidatus Nanoarchaeia archaeon]
MIGICPNCSIKLKDPPFNNRETNEVMITLNYRTFMDSGAKPKAINELGYCEVCKATLKDLKEQMIILKNQ